MIVRGQRKAGFQPGANDDQILQQIDVKQLGVLAIAARDEGQVVNPDVDCFLHGRGYERLE
jgi:hypothetical protein